jgi:L-aminopeptidase/D-esterase-like protein
VHDQIHIQAAEYHNMHRPHTMNASLLAHMIPGIRVGHWTDLDAATGCTVVLCEQGGIAGVDVRGAAPATRETDVLRPGNLVGRAHAILLTGGSAFGLAAASGVMRFLEERGAGFTTQAGPVPIVPAAALFDLSIGRSDVRPDAEAGYAACQAASETVEEGCVGAGTGATVAKIGGPGGAVKSGIGTGAQTLSDGTRIAALVAVNALGAVYEPRTGAPLAVPRSNERGWRPFGGTNTTIGVIATTAPLDPAGVNRLASIGHDGLALAIRPAHTLYDGDTLFALSLAAPDALAPTGPELVALGQAAAEIVAEAIVRSVRAATSLHGVPSYQA